MGKVLSSDPITKQRKVMHYSEHDDTYVIAEEQNADAILEANRAQRNSYRGAWEKHGEWGDHYARIPAVVWGSLVRKGIAQDNKRLLKWLDDRDNEPFRVRPGSLTK
jgi:hypothetical protein